MTALHVKMKCDHMLQCDYPVILNCYSEVKRPSVTAGIVYDMNKVEGRLIF